MTSIKPIISCGSKATVLLVYPKEKSGYLKTKLWTIPCETHMYSKNNGTYKRKFNEALQKILRISHQILKKKNYLMAGTRDAGKRRMHK